jgi:PAS domain S-box-containing protein
MSFLAFFDFFCVIAYLYFVAVILRRDPHSLEGKVYATAVGCFAIWSAGKIFMHSPGVSRPNAELAVNITAVGWISFAAVFLWVGSLYSSKQRFPRRRWFPWLIFILPAFFLYQQWSGRLIVDYARGPYGWVSVFSRSAASYGFYLYSVFFMIAGIQMFRIFLKRIGQRSASREAHALFTSAIPMVFVCFFVEVVASRWTGLNIPNIGHSVPLIWIVAMVGLNRYQFRTAVTPATAVEDILATMSGCLFLLNSEGKITMTNKALLDLLGYTASELNGKPVDILLGEVYVQHFRDNAMGGQEFRQEELTLKTKQGQLVPVIFSSSGLKDVAGDLAGIVCVATDITVHKQAEEELIKIYEQLKATQVQLIQSEKMAGIGQLAAGVAHEINNPISFIISNLEILKVYTEKISEVILALEELGRQMPPGEGHHSFSDRVEAIKQESDLAYIREDLAGLVSDTVEGAVRIKKIVSNLSSFARPDMTLSERAPVNDQIEAALKLVWNELKYNCTVEKDLGRLPLIPCNSGQLIQVFVNILLNASQAIKPGKGSIKIKSYLEGGCAVVEVSDTGAGIAKDNLAKIFDPFFTTKELGKGTGLGLSIVYNIIKNHKGTISVESQPKQGATFIIKLPLTVEP